VVKTSASLPLAPKKRDKGLVLNISQNTGIQFPISRAPIGNIRDKKVCKNGRMVRIRTGKDLGMSHFRYVAKWQKIRSMRDAD
jgi:hypothetical protein